VFLQALDIFGFKSFADKVRFQFSDGITALIGSNGSGKSNVVDAIKWVLGEQSARNMRAENMEDVLFNGTEERKALNVAEVTLTLSNEAGLLPLDAAEIAIRRRFYRSGESEYAINGAKALRKDVRGLFMDTGVGKAAYSVMEQGKIDQILSSKPEDRRYLFEEAAGITRFKEQRDEAERKLERTEENMRQVEGILAEARKSYDSLKTQAEKTARARKYAEDAFDCERDIQLLRLREKTADRDRAEAGRKQAAESRDRLRAEIDEISRSLSENLDAVNGLQAERAELEKTQIALARDKNAKEEQAKQASARRNEAREKIAQLEGRQRTLEERIETRCEEIDEQDASLRGMRQQAAENERNIQSFADNIALAGSRITANDREAAALGKQISALGLERGELQTALEAITEDIVAELDSRLKDAGYSSSAREKAEQGLRDALGRLRALAAGCKNLLADFAALPSPADTAARAFAANAFEAFSGVEAQLAALDAAAAEYARLTPAFIDEFLSPEGIITRKRAIDRNIRENAERAGGKQQDIESLRGENAGLAGKIDEYQATLGKLRVSNAQTQGQLQSAESQTRLMKRELANDEAALRELTGELDGEARRFEDIQEQLAETESELASLEYQGREMTKQILALTEEISRKTDDNSGRKAALEQKGAETTRHQERLERCDRDLAVAATDIRNIRENFRETHSRDLAEFEERMHEIGEPAAALREKLAETKQAQREQGHVNWMAAEEFAEAEKRHRFLSAQLADLQQARDELKTVAEGIRSESTKQFLDSYQKIKKNFHNMFRRLFEGGRAELRLLDPKNVLESGVEILAQPPGKKLESITLLSGGEKTMTAVALLFATYMVRPSPFCFLDEIDAALDGGNVGRFVRTLREFSHASQYVVITHNQKTAACADTLFGITMQESGVSAVFAIRPADFERNADAEGQSAAPFAEEDVEPEPDLYIPPPPARHARHSAQAEHT
jgi:chromosome segregation protein